MTILFSCLALIGMLIAGGLWMYRHGREVGELDVLHDADRKVLDDVKKADTARRSVGLGNDGDSGVHTDPNNRDNR